jgi:hypothetical protein
MAAKSRMPSDKKMFFLKSFHAKDGTRFMQVLQHKRRPGEQRQIFFSSVVRKNFLFITLLSDAAISAYKRINFSFTGNRSSSVAGSERLLLLLKNV